MDNFRSCPRPLYVFSAAFAAKLARVGGPRYGQGMPAPEMCRSCSSLASLDQGICDACRRSYGPRVARLLARCQADAEFAKNCLARLPEPARARFVALLSAKCLSPKVGPGLRYTRAGIAPNKRATA